MYEYLKGISLPKITAKYHLLLKSMVSVISCMWLILCLLRTGQPRNQIYVHQVVREDAHLLYGFRSEDEKSSFSV